MAITPPLSGGEHTSAHRHPKLLKQLVLPPNISGVSKTKTEQDNVTLGFSFYSLSMTFLHDANLSNAFFFFFSLHTVAELVCHPFKSSFISPAVLQVNSLTKTWEGPLRTLLTCRDDTDKLHSPVFTL